MAKMVTRYIAEGGEEFETLTEAEAYEEMQSLATALGQFTEHFPEDGYDAEAAAKWLLENYTMERKTNG